ncbi:MAG: hypothetical protein HC896_15075 [Bacteroidales bacterium]|nr:hypothetical protein [Bacteroidales bacterium]
MVQESVNNALRHAKAGSITVSLAHENSSLVITVEDDGVGFAMQKAMLDQQQSGKGLGLFNMKERAGFINADFEIDTVPGGGTVVRLELDFK